MINLSIKSYFAVMPERDGSAHQDAVGYFADSSSKVGNERSPLRRHSRGAYDRMRLRDIEAKLQQAVEIY